MHAENSFLAEEKERTKTTNEAALLLSQHIGGKLSKLSMSNNGFLVLQARL